MALWLVETLLSPHLGVAWFSGLFPLEVGRSGGSSSRLAPRTVIDVPSASHCAPAIGDYTVSRRSRFPPSRSSLSD